MFANICTYEYCNFRLYRGQCLCSIYWTNVWNSDWNRAVNGRWTSAKTSPWTFLLTFPGIGWGARRLHGCLERHRCGRLQKHPRRLGPRHIPILRKTSTSSGGRCPQWPVLWLLRRCYVLPYVVRRRRPSHSGRLCKDAVQQDRCMRRCLMVHRREHPKRQWWRRGHVCYGSHRWHITNNVQMSAGMFQPTFGARHRTWLRRHRAHRVRRSCNTRSLMSRPMSSRVFTETPVTTSVEASRTS